MGFERIGMDFMGGGMEGAGQGAMIAAGLKASGIAAGPYAIPLIAGMAGAGALTRILGGMADKPGEKMQMRLGNQQIAMNDLEIEAKRRAMGEDAAARRKTRMFQDVLSGIFGRYQKGAG